MSPKELTPKQRAHLKTLAHDKEELLQIGKNGLSEGFLKELEIALGRDELVKVRVGKFVEDSLADEAATKTQAQVVARIGRTVLFFRQAKEDSKIELPNA